MRFRTLALLGFLFAFGLVGVACSDEGFFDSQGVKIHYTVQGEGEPVLLIHGFTMNLQTQWAPIIRALEGEYRVIAIDNRGHGRSDKPHDPQKYGAEMVEDQVRLLDHLDIDRAHVVGYSMGGFITNKLLVTHPDRVKTATLGGAGWSRENDARMKTMTDLAESLEAGRGITPLIERLTPAGRPKPTEEQLRTINEMVMFTNDPKALAAVIRGMQGLVVAEEQLRANQVPTLALIGEEDPLKEGVDALAGIMPNLEVVVIDDADHMDAPRRAEFIDQLKQFLAKHRDKEGASGSAPRKVAEPAGASG
jgi:pimeloyl-ACP methyl ester carboxylesterase